MKKKSSGHGSKTQSSLKITPYSQIISLLLFAGFALFSRYYTTVVIQSFLILYSILLCRISVSKFSLKELIPLLPVLSFVFILNCFRGSGEILLSIGPIVIVRQGILRGAYFVIVIIQLWLMSKILTKGFGEKALLSALYTIDSAFSRSGNTRNFFLILYYILRIFSNTYAQLKLFTRKESFTSPGSSFSLKERVLIFFNMAFERSRQDFEGLRRISLQKKAPVPYDYLYIILELCCISLAFLFRDFLIKV